MPVIIETDDDRVIRVIGSHCLSHDNLNGDSVSPVSLSDSADFRPQAGDSESLGLAISCSRMACQESIGLPVREDLCGLGRRRGMRRHRAGFIQVRRVRESHAKCATEAYRGISKVFEARIPRKKIRKNTKSLRFDEFIHRLVAI
jgi:hypothetical protein